MKFIALFAVALPTVAHAQATPRLAGCFFAKTFKAGSDLSESGVEDFKAVAGAEIRCFTGCVDGGAFTTAYNVDGAVGDSANEGEVSEDNQFCESTEKFTVDADTATLGWTIDMPGEYTAVALTCFCTDDGSDFTIDAGEEIIDDISNDGCFSETATVQVKGEGEVTMKDLKLGDKVMTAKNKYEPVYSFGHRKEEMVMDFFQIYTADDAAGPLEMTGNHMIMVADSRGRGKATRADHLQIGDHLLNVEAEKQVTVTLIESAQKRGLYMPLTPSGQIVVNSFLASNYISISDTAPGVVEHSQMFFPMNEQILSHWWMSPVRMLCMGVSSTFCSNGSEESSAYETLKGDEGILPWLLMGRHFAHVAEDQPTVVRFVLGVPTFLLFGMLNVVEHALFGPACAPFLFVIIVALAIAMKKKLANGRDESKTEAGYRLLSPV